MGLAQGHRVDGGTSTAVWLLNQPPSGEKLDLLTFKPPLLHFTVLQMQDMHQSSLINCCLMDVNIK